MTSAEQLVIEIRTFYLRLQMEKRPGTEIEILACGPFGQHRFTKMMNNGHDLLRIDLAGDVNQPAFILTHPGQCSFFFCAVADNPQAPKPQIGFNQYPPDKEQ